MKNIKTIVSALAALFWGGAIISLYLNGTIGTVLDPKFHLITLIGALGMVLLGLFVLLTLNQASSCCHEHHHGHDEHEPHEHPEPNPLIVLLLMVFPLGAALASDTSMGFSTSVLARKGLYEDNIDLSAYTIPEFTREMLEESTATNENGQFQLPLRQIYFSAGDEGMMKVLAEVEVEIEAQVVPELKNNSEGKRLRLYSTLMTCCAADAIVLAFPVEFPFQAPTFSDRSWVKASGKIVYQGEGLDLHPVLLADDIKSIPAPLPTGFSGW